jgi:DnaJ-class molecular chaperone
MIPDFLLPLVGWLDDGVVIGTIYYLIRYGKLPNFFFKKKYPFNQPFEKPFKQNFKQGTGNFTSEKTRKKDQNNNNNKRASTSSQTPYEILGINNNADKNEIKNAYRKAIKKYHPDKVSHLGKDFSNLANEKFLEIQKAYDTLMK